ncbi:MAG: hypothetical protein JO353_14020 [Phycisphaerae bacterium]|nr:hypothetical protein [Phycisphaerae bacterium]
MTDSSGRRRPGKPWKGGWIHRLTDSVMPAKRPVVARPKSPPPAPTIHNDFAALSRSFRTAAASPKVRLLADELGLNVTTLRDHQIGYATAKEVKATATECFAAGCWAFPMRDGATDRITGIRLRSGSFKYSITGSDAQGLFIPRGLRSGMRFLCAPEGPTSNGALHMLGIPSIGRPNNSLGASNLCRAAERLLARMIVLFGDNDLKSDGRWPGRDGALSVAAALAAARIRVRVVMPPKDFKDVRDWVRGGATEHDVIRWIEDSARRMTCDAS